MANLASALLAGEKPQQLVGARRNGGSRWSADEAGCCSFRRAAITHSSVSMLWLQRRCNLWRRRWIRRRSSLVAGREAHRLRAAASRTRDTPQGYFLARISRTRGPSGWQTLAGIRQRNLAQQCDAARIVSGNGARNRRRRHQLAADNQLVIRFRRRRLQHLYALSASGGTLKLLTLEIAK